MSPEQPPILIYCDGACSKGTGGYGILLMSGSHQKEISGAAPATTSNRMELTAAIKALEALKKPSVVTLRTDSQYLCNAFNKRWIANWTRNQWTTHRGTPVLNRDLWETLIVQTQRHQVTWEWVRGHGDDEYNNRCDELAVAARKQYAEEHLK